FHAEDPCRPRPAVEVGVGRRGVPRSYGRFPALSSERSGGARRFVRDSRTAAGPRAPARLLFSRVLAWVTWIQRSVILFHFAGPAFVRRMVSCAPGFLRLLDRRAIFGRVGGARDAEIPERRRRRAAQPDARSGGRRRLARRPHGRGGTCTVRRRRRAFRYLI